MSLITYPVIADRLHERFEFFSEGPKGRIPKVVQYQKIGIDTYNIAFGDWKEEEQIIDDKARTNNNDRDKILATVALTVNDFIGFHPNAVIVARGGTPARTRLYQMGIAANWHSIKGQFDVEGYYNGNWELFKLNKNYQGFALKAR